MNTAATVREYIEMMKKGHEAGMLKKAPDWRYTHEEFLLQFGRAWEYKKLPKIVRRGEPKNCFINAFRLMGSRFTYVEGYALYIIPVHHAWCVDDAGRVVDPTWDPAWNSAGEHLEYFGVAFRPEYVSKIAVKTKVAGILYNHPDWDVLKDDPDEIIHPNWRNKS